MPLSLSEIQEYLDKTDFNHLPAYHIAVLRNITLETIKPYLRYGASQAGLRAEIQFGGYDQVMQESLSATGLLNSKTDCVLVFTYLPTLSPLLATRENAITADQKAGELTRLEKYFSATLAGIRKQTEAMILWHTFDATDDAAQKLNQCLTEMLKQQTHAYAVDLSPLLSRLGEARYYDPRYWEIAKAPYTREALEEIASEDLRYIRSSKGLQKKCLVLDCDEVLWGGIIGEDGLEGIRLGCSASGLPYYEFQEEILKLYDRGIILALCSKNNEKDVWEVFQKHPDMLLREKHIAAAQINWDDKATNLRRIAKQLNIGLESLVLFDDSPFEADLVRQNAPEVTVVTLPKDDPSQYRGLLASSGLFDRLITTAEDTRRGAMYHEEKKRKELSTTFADMDAYLTSLEMEATVAEADPASIPRIAQLTQKTNQFNLTTQRYTEEDIRQRAASGQSDILYLHLKDRLGDSGIVGVAILDYENKTAVLSSLLLSCRVLGRKVEDVFLSCCLKKAQDRGASRAIGLYRPTPKNEQVRAFYEARAFKPLPSEGKEEFKFERLLQGFTYQPLPVFKKITFNSLQSLMNKVAQ